MARKKWSFSAGERPNTVTVAERQPRGVIYAKAWDASTVIASVIAIGALSIQFAAVPELKSNRTSAFGLAGISVPSDIVESFAGGAVGSSSTGGSSVPPPPVDVPARNRSLDGTLTRPESSTA